MIRRRLILCAVATAALLAGSANFVPSLAADDKSQTQTTQDEIRQLVRQLGDASYAQRQRASKQLVRQGIAARDALEAALKSPDAEVRARASEILELVVDADFQTRLESFAADIDDRQHLTLPTWDRFSQLVGSDRQARLLFVEMQRAEPALLEALAAGPKPAIDAFNARSLSLQQSINWVPIYGGQAPISLGSVAALLFVGGASDVIVEEQAGVQVYGFIHQMAFQNAIRSGAQSSRLKKLLGGWIAKNNGASISFQNLMLAFNFDLKEGLDLAIRMLKNDGGQPHVRQYAILAIGKFGNREHVPIVEPFLKDATPCLSQRVNNRDVQTQIRDVALAVLISLTGQDAKQYGFDHLQLNQQLLFQPGTLGFAEPVKRDAALKKWAEWSTKESK